MPRQRHHFIPRFYLQRWASTPDGKLFRYVRAYDRKVVVAARSPKNAGFGWDLYRIPGVSAAIQNRIEEVFMQQVDATAAELIKQLATDARSVAMNGPQRAILARFLLSLIMRNPEEIAKLKAKIRAGWNDHLPGQEEVYRNEIWRPGYPPTLSEYEALVAPHAAEQAALNIATNLMQHVNVRRFISQMNWAVLDVAMTGKSLMTSDRPVVMTNGFGRPDGHIVLPISPSKVLAASTIPQTIDWISQMPRAVLVRDLNRKVIGQAVREVFAIDPNQIERVQKYMSKLDHPSFL